MAKSMSGKAGPDPPEREMAGSTPGAPSILTAAVGVFFGFYPARRAAGVDPIEALRHE